MSWSSGIPEVGRVIYALVESTVSNSKPFVVQAYTGHSGKWVIIQTDGSVDTETLNCDLWTIQSWRYV